MRSYRRKKRPKSLKKKASAAGAVMLATGMIAGHAFALPPANTLPEKTGNEILLAQEKNEEPAVVDIDLTTYDLFRLLTRRTKGLIDADVFRKIVGDENFKIVMPSIIKDTVTKVDMLDAKKALDMIHKEIDPIQIPMSYVFLVLTQDTSVKIVTDEMKELEGTQEFSDTQKTEWVNTLNSGLPKVKYTRDDIYAIDQISKNALKGFLFIKS